MPNLSDLIEQRSKLEADAVAFAKADNFTAESRATFDKMSSDIDALSEDITRLERTAKFSKPAPREHGPDPKGEDRSTAVSKELRNYLIQGRNGVENRDLLTINANGAAVIPQLFYPLLITAQKFYGGVLNAVKNLPTDNGEPMKIALTNTQAMTLHTNMEGQTSVEVDPPMQNALLEVEELRTDIVKLSYDELQDSYFDLDGFIRDIFGDIYYRGLNKLVTNGSGSKVASIVTGYAANAVTTLGVGTVTYQDILNLVGALDPAYTDGAVFVMNSATKLALQGITLTTGLPLFDPNPAGGAFSTILGFPIVLNQALPTVATGNTVIQFGNFKAGYIFRQVNPGLAIKRSDDRYFEQAEVGFLGLARAGGVVTDAGTHPIVNLTVK